ncbi:MAG: PAS domain S-box protein [Proteobacteria bacterium]|nr:PAS domain S-box protein [Pseudomonadota bacterium]MBU4469763.1 PAS domain S-box protein [Pseudomonadota bacterium]MCG2753857.1 PAS domain S-box protein [Desulfobacteraceae bacterium]
MKAANNPDQLNNILNAMEDGIYIVRHDYTVEFMNRAMIEKFGDGTGKKCFEVINNGVSICPWCRAKEVFQDGETLHSEVYLSGVDRTYQRIELPIRNVDGTVSKLNIFHDITNRKEQEERLRASEDDYRRLFEHVGVGVYITSKDGKILNANKALLDMLAYTDKAEFLKITLQTDLYVRPDDRSKFQEMIERDRSVIDYEVEWKRKDGATIPVLLTAHVRYDVQGNVLGYEGICSDLSHRKQMERNLKEAHDFYNNILQSSPNAIYATDIKGNIILWNRVAEEVLGLTVQEVMGRMTINQIFQDGIAEKIMEMTRSPEYGGTGKLRSFPLVYERKDGRLVEGNLSSAIIYDDQGHESALVGIFVDLKDRLDMERQLRQTQEQLLQSEKLAAMGRLTSQIAHELNNPLYGIMNALELMKTEIPPENRRRKVLDMALSEIVRLAEMLRKMLTFSKPDQEKKQPVNINSLLEGITMLHKKQLQEYDIKLKEDIEEDLPPVYASANQLRQVFLNLIANARDAMPQGGLLTVETRAAGDKVTIHVRDNGTGIKPENLQRIFDTFYTTKDSVKGVGLGLSVCYGFIKDHGGDIKVQSQWGEGTTISVILPAYKSV